jgi:cell wall-associated NlpC family hydrolase
MTASIDGPDRGIDAIRPASPSPGRSTAGPGHPGDAATFDALVERAAASGVGPGRLVRELPTGTAAEAWARWTPSAQALGSRAAGGAPAAALGSGPTAGGALGLDGFTAGRSGVVFPQARNAGEAVINAAADHLGVPYLWGGTDAENGFDCSGLIQDAYRRIGVDLPKWSRHQATMGIEVPSLDQARPGDILAFGQPVDHVGLYVGDGKMLHAPRTGDVVKISDIARPIVTIRRVVAPTGPPAALDSGAPVGVAPAVARSAPLGSELPYRDLFEASGRRWDVDPALLAAVARAESGFDPEAVSPVGAQGLMQFMPQTAAEMGVDPWNPASAIDGAARYLRQSLDRFGSVEEAIASYNAGPGAVARHGGIPPYPETQNYVRTVLEAWRS